LGIHLGSNFGLHWVVSCSRREFSNESISSAFDGEETEEEANDVIVRSDAVKTLLMTSLRVELSLLDLVACTTVFDILVCCGVVVVVVNAVTDVVVATIAIAAGTIIRRWRKDTIFFFEVVGRCVESDDLSLDSLGNKFIH